jgi:hypothetical protein
MNIESQTTRTIYFTWTGDDAVAFFHPTMTACPKRGAAESQSELGAGSPERNWIRSELEASRRAESWSGQTKDSLPVMPMEVWQFERLI